VRAATLLLLFAAGVHAEDSLGVRVNRALDSSAKWLVSRQDKDGAWQKSDKVHPIGRTALCACALMHAGYARDHEAVNKAVQFLQSRNFEARSTYEAACLLLFLHGFGSRFDKHIRRTCKWLVENFDQGTRLWGYPGSTPDLSNTQFAILGLAIGELHGFKVPKDLWKDIARGVLVLQHETGAFRYKPDVLYRGTMTHAALFTLAVATEGRRPTADEKKAMTRGHAWAEKNYSVTKAPWGRGHHPGHYYYYLYGLERYAQIFAKKTIAGHDWYREGAEELLKRQADEGSWNNLADTAFAILFLRRVVFTQAKRREVGAGGSEPSAKKEKKAADPKPAHGLPFLRQWLINGPHAGKPREDDMLYTQHFSIARAKPVAGAGKWTAYRSPEDRIDFGVAARKADYCTYYAATYLHCATAVDAVLWIGSDDGFKLFLNGKEIREEHHHDYSGDDKFRVPVKLVAGRNLLILKVENTGYSVHFKARISDEKGARLAGVTPSLRRRKPR
jgi:hypothetical protein